MSNFDRITNVKIVQLGDDVPNLRAVDRIYKLSVFPGEQSKIPGIIHPDNPTETEKSYLRYQNYQRQVPDIGFYIIANCVIAGSVFPLVDGAILDMGDVIPEYVRSDIDAGRRSELYLKNRIRRHIEVPVLILPSTAYPIYGHWLLDSLPRAWLYQTFLSRHTPDLHVLLPHDTPEFAKTILTTYFGFKENSFIYYNWRQEEIHLKQLILPSMLHKDHAFHATSFNNFIDNFVRKEKNNDTSGSGNLLYVSRQEFRQESISYKRKIRNEESIISLAKQYGYDIIYPEKMTWGDQIRQYSQALSVIGESGSGLHNTVFGSSECKVTCFRPVNQVQATLAAVRSQTLMMLGPINEVVKHEMIDFEIDLNKVEAAFSAGSLTAR